MIAIGLEKIRVFHFARTELVRHGILTESRVAAKVNITERQCEMISSGGGNTGAVACLGILAWFCFIPFVACVTFLCIEIVHHFLLLIIGAAPFVR